MSIDIQLAQSLAAKYHAGQKYGTVDYTCHLEEVANSVTLGHTDERLIVVAWLHDILEDTTCVVPTLQELFEDNVVVAVEAMTRGRNEDKQQYLLRCKANPMARIVKVHDSLCNLRASVMRFDPKRIQKYTQQINFLVSP
jgi:(p)ppGpp synthase/HD superfamily hydrolase